MGLLDGKRIVITGVLTDASIAFGVARLAQSEGAEIVLTGAGRGLSLTRRTARKLATEPEVLEFDVTDPDQIAALREQLSQRWDRVDGALHAIGFAPEVCLGGTFLDAQWSDVSVAVQHLGLLLQGAGRCRRPAHDRGRRAGRARLRRLRVVARPTTGWVWPRPRFESTSRYLARYLGPQGVRVNLVAAGPLKTLAAKSIPGFSQFEDVWDPRSPLGWDASDSSAVAKACVALLSDWFPSTTGEIVHVDGGFHATGA